MWPNMSGRYPTGIAAAELLGRVPADLEVPDHRLARDEELVHQDLPRPDRQATRGDQPLDPGAALGPDLEVVVDGRDLAVEGEGEPLVGLHRVEELVDELDEPHPEHLERLVPLAVPVGVRDEMDDGGSLDGPSAGLAPKRVAASPPISSPRCAASRAIARWQVTMSVRPSAIPVAAVSRRTSGRANASSSRSNASSIESKASRRRVSSSPVETTSGVGSWSRYGDGNDSSTEPPT